MQHLLTNREPEARLLLVGETTELAQRYGWFAPERHVTYKGARSQQRALGAGAA